MQVLSGLFLSIHYNSGVEEAFGSVQHIIRDVPGGWFLQRVHANGASFFFIILYAHLCRGLYYASYRIYWVWLTGMLILVLSMGVAFTGYVLVWGQIRYWGLTVIVNLVGALPYVGSALVEWILGGPRAGGATLSRFFRFHFIIPIIIACFIVLHIVTLHAAKSSTVFERHSPKWGVVFYPLFVVKDVLGFFSILTLFSVAVFVFPDFFADAANSEMANTYFAPAHIKPEWYFLWAYAILRCFPSKGGGILLMLSALLAIYLVRFSRGISVGVSAGSQALFWLFVANLFVLSYLGGCPAVAPYVWFRALFTAMYFLLLLLMTELSFYKNRGIIEELGRYIEKTEG